MLLGVLIPAGAAHAAAPARPADSGTAKVYLPDGPDLAVVDQGSGSVSSTISLAGVPGIPGEIGRTVLSPDGAVLYVGTGSGLYAYRDSDHALLSAVAVSGGAGDFVLSPDGRRAYVFAMGTITQVDMTTMTVLGVISDTGTPAVGVVSPDGSRLYVGHRESSDMSVINTRTFTVIRQIFVGANNYTMLMSPDGSKVYLSNYRRASEKVVDTATNAVSTITLADPVTMAGLSPDGSKLYLVSRTGSPIFAVDTASDTVTATIPDPLGSKANYSGSVTFTPDSSQAYVVADNGITVIDTATAAVVRTIAGASAVAFSPDGTTAYVTGYRQRNTVTVVDTATGAFLDTIAVGSSPTAVLINPGGSRLYVTNWTDGSISAINTASDRVAATIPNSEVNDDLIAISPNGAVAYVDGYGNTLREVNLPSGTSGGVVAVGAHVSSVAFSPDSSLAYADYGSGMAEIDVATGRVAKTLALPGTSYHGYIAVSPDGTKAYVSSTSGATNTVSVIDTATLTVTATIPVGLNPGEIAFAPDGSKAYVDVPGNGGTPNSTVTVIDTATDTVTANIAVGFQSNSLAITPDGSQVYTANSGDDTLSVINTATETVTATITVSGPSEFEDPEYIAITPDGALAYTTDFVGQALSVIDLSTGTVTGTIPLGFPPSPLAIGSK